MNVVVLLWLALGLVAGQAGVEDALAPGVSEEAASGAANSTSSTYVLLYPGFTLAQLQAKCQTLQCSKIITVPIQGLVVDIDPAAASSLSVDDPTLGALTPNIPVSLFQESAAEAPSEEAPPPNIKPYWQRPTPYWLDRLDQAQLPLDGVYAPMNTCPGTRIYILDSGVRSTHMEFRVAGNPLLTRVLPGYTVQSISSRISPNASGLGSASSGTDTLGHGTHVASLAAGLYSGVCTSANIVPVRAVAGDGSADTTDLLEALGWIVNDVKNHTGVPCVINMSVGTTTVNDVLQAAVNNTVSTYGIPIIAAAGNSGVDTCTNTPARSVFVITMSASNKTDGRPSYSNFGRCTTAYAPGDQITAAGNLCDTCSQTLSGTSMAAPIGSGIAAMYGSMSPTTFTWYSLTDFFNAAYARNPTTFIRVVQTPPLGRVLSNEGTCLSLLNELGDCGQSGAPAPAPQPAFLQKLLGDPAT